jgi:chaperonin GroES
MELKPIGNKLIVLRAPKPKNAAGLYIPDLPTEVNDKGRVLAVGPLVKNIERGHMVLFAKFSGHEVKVDGIPMLVMTDKDVIATLEEVA